MSDNKKYYYIKLKDNYFDQDNIKILESMPNGYIYSLIVIKLYLKATKYGGQLKMTDSIPYDPEKIDILANVIHHDVSHVREAIKIGRELDLITVVDSGDIWMTEIQNLIGKSSSEADRIRSYRNSLKNDSSTDVVQVSYKCTPKKEKEKKLEIKYDPSDDIPFFKNKDFKPVWSDFMKHRTRLKCGKTDRTIKMLAKRLMELSKSKDHAIALIDQAIFYGWKTLYDLKPEFITTQKKQVTNTKKFKFYEEIEKGTFDTSNLMDSIKKGGRNA